MLYRSMMVLFIYLLTTVTQQHGTSQKKHWNTGTKINQGKQSHWKKWKTSSDYLPWIWKIVRICYSICCSYKI